MYPTLYNFGPFELPSYGFLLAMAFLASIQVAVRAGKREGIPSLFIVDISIGIMVSSIVGAKVFYLLLNARESLASFSALMDSLIHGFVFYGGFLGALAFCFWFIWPRVEDPWRVFDVLALAVPLGQGIGRLGCFMAGCCFGQPTNLPWAVQFPPDSPAAGAFGVMHHIHPTQLYSAGAGLTLFGILLLTQRLKWFHGQVLAHYLLGYAVIRTVLEVLRGDAARGVFFGISTSQFVSLAIFLGGIVVYAVRRGTERETELPEVKGYSDAKV